MAGKAKVFWEVHCETHGTQLSKGMKERFVRVPPPEANFNHKKAGCPMCKQDK